MEKDIYKDSPKKNRFSPTLEGPPQLWFFNYWIKKCLLKVQCKVQLQYEQMLVIWVLLFFISL